MSATAEEALAVLRSIDGTLKEMLALARQRTQAARGGSKQAIASDRDLDGQYGNPELRFTPRDWTGAPFKGRRFADCPPALLDMVAETFDYFAKQAEEKDERTDKGKPVADYKRQDAARARGWAARIRSGKHVQTQPPPSATDSEWEPEAAEGWS